MAPSKRVAIKCLRTKAPTSRRRVAPYAPRGLLGKRVEALAFEVSMTRRRPGAVAYRPPSYTRDSRVYQPGSLPEYSQGKRLEQDNSTRWNSWSHMIGCALWPGVQPAIRMFCSEHKDELWDETLTTDEWSHLEEVFGILKILEQTTLDVEGSFGSLGKVIMTMDF
ncbi:hypothetical protein VC83_08105 [Pseudogymnoascus destructans]|uniref:Uncharacterized protein n=1 Tax=Pseudogymnoascus destructans TaxID=655981 RepID=A0A176ZZ58_9PEZI|nr:uncharacterized protein VC83_08105 [Pseudogymnoascus destructans]OAF55325.1 hypothetical protein VC83_08105 [Pseudogymnoascus destructans]